VQEQHSPKALACVEKQGGPWTTLLLIPKGF